MDIFAVITLSLAPGVFWLWFFYKKDKLEPEPKKLVVYMFFLGMLSVVPAIMIEYPFREFSIIQIVIAAPIIEECLKISLVRLTIFKNVEFNEPMDGIIYSVSIALGFASAENAYYILSTYLAPQIALGKVDPVFGFEMVWKLYLIRAFLTVPGHAIWSSMWGYALGCSKFISGGNVKIIIKGLLIAILLHSLFNFLMTNYIPGAVGMLILLPLMWRMLYNRIELAIMNSPFNDLKCDSVVQSEKKSKDME